ncbi:conserved hypothetical protein [Candidatus Propionivibrio aalborgensis]|uniref:N-acetyl sugar amidotransferase n=1 Tax=Candidatus Propionivibrio aalborgensis TaxID=1860101 RepID=A0A1A8XT57_9RHOO|nr:hypothetical protein [Candidatus Propionivibrio aalborgensis]SBT08269.1 conserved hypothetical protein [Candidatus Propionivibrio aalborgensis]
MKRCKQCLVPESVPGISLSKDDVCNLCLDKQTLETAVAKEEEARLVYEADFEKTLSESRGQGEYDCLVPLSGGKDSIYLLYRLKAECKLKVLAFTVDVNIPGLAWDNIRRALAKLNIDHIIYSPSHEFYDKTFRYLLRNQEERGAVYTISYVYAPLFEGDAIKLAMEKGIPLVLAGYSPGQPEPERMLYEFSRQLICETDWTPPEMAACSEFSAEDLSRFYNPKNYPSGTQFPRYLAPFHAWAYNQEDIMRKVVELGLVATSKHANPIHSNYPINWLLMYSDLRAFGYNPYAPEFSALIRNGKANLNYWRIMGPLVDFLIRHRLGPGKEVTRSLNALGLTADDLRITKPRGAYDPIPGRM